MKPRAVEAGVFCFIPILEPQARITYTFRANARQTHTSDQKKTGSCRFYKILLKFTFAVISQVCYWPPDGGSCLDW